MPPRSAARSLPVSTEMRAIAAVERREAGAPDHGARRAS